ncbi:A disintegrin and metalloproteinase with thrombospondin motifs 5-like [Cetorhinus maximus]
MEGEETDCLLNKPLVSFSASVPLAGRSYDADQQCRLSFGPGHRWRPESDPCRMLWCMARRQGQWHHSSKNLPAADGTDCGGGRVCLSGECVSNWQQAKPVDGNWGSWAPWGPCSRSCGGGVQFSRRFCDNPVPAAFGRYCSGRRDIFQSCNLSPCPDNDGRTFREEQCAARNGPDPDEEDIFQEWEPYYHGIREADLCKLHCILKGTSQVTVFNIRVKDGTRCSPHSDAVCVRSRCVKTGCDGVIGSRKMYNKCGECGGEDSACRKVVRRYRSRTVNYSDVVTIPAGAANLKARQEFRRGQARFTAYLALKRADGAYVLNGNNQISGFESLVSVAGVALGYSGWGLKRDELWAITRGALTEPLTLQVYNPNRRRAVSVIYSYYVRRAEGGSPGQGGGLGVLGRGPALGDSPTRQPNGTEPTALTSPKVPSSTVPTALTSPKVPSSTAPTALTSPKVPSSTVPTALTSPKVPSSTVPTALTSPKVPSSTVPTALTSPKVPSPTPGKPSAPPIGNAIASWWTGPWQACAVSCGVGWRVRRLICQDGRGARSEGCDRQYKPSAVALCVAGRC